VPCYTNLASHVIINILSACNDALGDPGWTVERANPITASPSNYEWLKQVRKVASVQKELIQGYCIQPLLPASLIESKTDLPLSHLLKFLSTHRAAPAHKILVLLEHDKFRWQLKVHN
jgi:hypothetical protein